MILTTSPSKRHQQVIVDFCHQFRSIFKNSKTNGCDVYHLLMSI